MAIVVPAGDSQVEFLYQNNYEVASSAIKILFALFAIAFILIRSRPGIASSALVLALSIMVWKNSYTIPGIKNSEIPERPPGHEIVQQEINQTRLIGDDPRLDVSLNTRFN